jgi:hypothetical protein
MQISSGIEDRLPRNYEPKISIKIQKLETKFVTRDADYKGDERENPEDTENNETEEYFRNLTCNF